jgi:hypothetical protein
MIINHQMFVRACALAEELQDLLRELNRGSLLDPDSFSHLVAAREQTEEAVARLSRVRCRR